MKNSRFLGRHKLWHMPVRLATGAFILNSGLNKRSVDDERAKGLHSMACAAFPFFENVDPQRFVAALSTGEIALGTTLLAPTVSPMVAGLALGTFSGGLLRMYLKVPGMRQEGSLRPSQQGTALAKDVWMFSIALALVLDSLAEALKPRKKNKKTRHYKAVSPSTS